MSHSQPPARRYRRYGQFATHKETRVEHLISSAGAELQYPPPYSPNHLDGRSRLKFRERAFAEVGMTTAGAFAGHSAGNAKTVSVPPSEV